MEEWVLEIARNPSENMLDMDNHRFRAAVHTNMAEYVPTDIQMQIPLRTFTIIPADIFVNVCAIFLDCTVILNRRLEEDE